MNKTIFALKTFDKTALIGGAIGGAALFMGAKYMKVGGKKLSMPVRIGAGIVGLVAGAAIAMNMMPTVSVSVPAATPAAAKA